MYMTHYMELLSTTSNLLLFMALPVVLAETAAISELMILFSKKSSGALILINRLACLGGAIVFVFIDFYMMKNVVLPLSSNNGWYGLIDKIAVYFFILGGLTMIALGIFTIKPFARIYGDKLQKGVRIMLLSAFLVISHIAMIAGMADPRLDPEYKALVEAKDEYKAMDRAKNLMFDTLKGGHYSAQHHQHSHH